MNSPVAGIEVPARLRSRPRDHRGFLVPRFVAWFKAGVEVDERTPGAEPDFRVISRHWLRECVRKRRCWLCGQPLGSRFAFVLGPMCAVTRTNSEPPCHTDCATYAALACPFLSRPRMRRNYTPHPAETIAAPGAAIDRNPGAGAVWVTQSYKLFDAHHGNAGTLFNVGPPLAVTWWRESRLATRAEIDASIAEGLPALQALADSEPDPVGARKALAECVADLQAWLP